MLFRLQVFHRVQARPIKQFAQAYSSAGGCTWGTWRIYCRMDIGVCDGVAERMGVEVRRGVSAAELTTFRGGGEAARVYVPRSAERAAEFAAECARLGAEFFVLGGGSKTLIADGEVLRPVLSTAKMRAVTFAGEDEGRVFLRAESGARVHDLMRACAVYGCGGVEFMAGVRASAGGMVRMNAGAFGEQTADIVLEAEILNALTGETERKKRENIPFGYRRGAEGFVLAVTFALPRMTEEEREKRRAAFVGERKKRQPRLPSCGSVFRNCGGVPVGALIEDAGLKGLRLGGAEISRKHANFIVNAGGATTGDFLGLAAYAAERLGELFGVSPEKEFEILQDDLPF